MCLFRKVEKKYLKYNVNLNKRVGKDRVFLELAGLLLGISLVSLNQIYRYLRTADSPVIKTRKTD